MVSSSTFETTGQEELLGSPKRTVTVGVRVSCDTHCFCRNELPPYMFFIAPRPFPSQTFHSNFTMTPLLASWAWGWDFPAELDRHLSICRMAAVFLEPDISHLNRE